MHMTPTWALFSTADLLTAGAAFAGFAAVAVVLRTAFKVNR